MGEEEFYADGERNVGRGEERQFLRLVSRRLSGVPLAYLTHEKEFWSLNFAIYPGVLIPRPESELIVEKVVRLASQMNEPASEKDKTSDSASKEKKTNKSASKKGKADKNHADSQNSLIADIGTGCGNIAMSIAKELPDAQIVATDISKTALKVARLNSQKLGVSNVIFPYGSLFAPLERFKLQGKCDFIVSNPPYVSHKEWETLQPEVRDFEPKRALVAGKTGLEFIQKLVKGAPQYLKPVGYLLFEIGYGQKDEVLCLLNTSNDWRSIQCFDDLNAIPRVVACSRKGFDFGLEGEIPWKREDLHER
jgi:release factor glutamine methyltransferase